MRTSELNHTTALHMHLSNCICGHLWPFFTTCSCSQFINSNKQSALACNQCVMLPLARSINTPAEMCPVGRESSMSGDIVGQVKGNGETKWRWEIKGGPLANWEEEDGLLVNHAMQTPHWPCWNGFPSRKTLRYIARKAGSCYVGK